ncbi:hypothetical protein PRIC1_008066 [Phytophthora ramorum]
MENTESAPSSSAQDTLNQEATAKALAKFMNNEVSRRLQSEPFASNCLVHGVSIFSRPCRCNGSGQVGGSSHPCEDEMKWLEFAFTTTEENRSRRLT